MECRKSVFLHNPLALFIWSFICEQSILMTFSKNLANICWELGLLIWLLLSSQKMIVGRWYVQLPAIWHWYLPLTIYITFLNFVLHLSIPSSFSSSLKTNKLFFNLVSINQTEWSTISACPSLMRSLNGDNIEGTNGLKIYV